MKKLIGFGLLVVFLMIVGYRIVTHGDEPTTKSIEAYQEESGVPVEVEVVQRTNLAIARHFTGTIKGKRQADAMANTTQKIIKLDAKAGDYVKKDRVVAQLDADITSNMSPRLRQSKARFEDAKRDLDRMTSLLESGAISRQAFEKAKVQYETARENYQAANKLVNIRAPISGIVTHVFYKVGETVSSGRPIIRIAQLDEMLIEVMISETEIAGIQNGQEAVVTLAAYPGTEFSGTLQELSLSADPRTRAFTAWIGVENKDGLLRPGMFAKVKVFVTAKENVLAISKDAIIEQENRSMVYVVNSNQQAEFREIQRGISSGKVVEVLSGLNENDRVVVLGHNKLAHGSKVNVVK
ncbi:MAG: efflux RND transporter periplasmic adaptor subunit [bacterium]